MIIPMYPLKNKKIITELTKINEKQTNCLTIILNSGLFEKRYTFECEKVPLINGIYTTIVIVSENDKIIMAYDWWKFFCAILIPKLVSLGLPTIHFDYNTDVNGYISFIMKMTKKEIHPVDLIFDILNKCEEYIVKKNEDIEEEDVEEKSFEKNLEEKMSKAVEKI